MSTGEGQGQEITLEQTVQKTEGRKEEIRGETKLYSKDNTDMCTE